MKKLKIATAAATLLLPGALLITNPVLAQSAGKSGTIHPDPNSSVGGSKSERTNDGNVLPQGSPQSGTVEKGNKASDSSQPRSRDSRPTAPTGKTGDTTVGKDTDQPNQPR